ncbi:TonB-dependent vitamin B12 receptor [Lysobacter sp. TLK-CK17T]|uniref:TonB-dependent vitamin B12 receptor n=1 Tax=Marilutibacter chinensis TaxID=2912247 RepID=A0ABS9HSY5_9GAMM|nr:TonB-dependent vitamin B12 receptor [Lysobacter chinensis]MCF7222025.1 TonB-dependent vitamin B12 receptor [Lysobacter chinensis]
MATTLFPVLFPVAPALAEGVAADLEGVVVTATRTARTQDQTLATVTVIDRVEIERLQPPSLPDLLRGRAGISLANNGGPGKSTSLFLRGTESDHVLVLVDGVRIGSATSGGAALQDIPVEQIERIEIVRGPFSSLYGSEALGGVVQIFTRRPRGPFEPNAMAASGSEGTWRASAGVAGRGADGWYSVQAAHESTEGINAYRGTRNFDPDRDGYRNSSLSVQGGHRFGERWDGDVRVFRSEGRNEYDGGPASEADTVQQVVGGQLRYVAGPGFRLTASAGTSADLSDNYFDGAFYSRFDTRRQLAGLQADIGIGDGLLTLGFDWQRDEVEGTTDYALDSRINRGAFAQWQQAFGAQSLQASVRRDDNEQFGGRTTGSLLWGWDFTDALRLTASVGTAFKAPTFNELYFPGYGNPALGPETSRSGEIGLRGEHGWGRWSIDAYQTRIDDMIAYDADLGPFGGPNNIDRARIRGVEAVIGTTVAGWELAATATLLDPENDADASGYPGNVLPRRAKRSGRVDLDRRFGALSLGASISGAGERHDNLANTRRMGGYGLADLRVGYVLSPDWQLRLSVDNVFDKQYETATFYNQPGRQWLLSLRWRPDA